MWGLAVQVLILIALLYSTGHNDYLVKVNEGTLQGVRMKSVNGLNYFTFSGIPYAEPPTGHLRFKAPVPKNPWLGVRDATAEGPVCTQFSNSEVIGEEDCLYLNVYTPQIHSTELRKVMVWIHGVGFAEGNSGLEYFGPDFLLEKDVLVVTFNYRLDVLGFLSLQNELVPGNMGLKDQNLALKWVYDNINAFGGDFSDITLFGASAGAASTHFHIMSSMSAGLFKRAILQSGSAFSPLHLTETPRFRAFALAESLGFQTGNDWELLEFLRSVDAHSLISNAMAALTYEDAQRMIVYPFVPCIEPDVPGAFMYEHPTVLMSEGRFNAVPLIVGVTSAECNFFVSQVFYGSLSTSEQIESFDKNFETVIAPDIQLTDPIGKVVAAKLAHSFYFGNRPISLKDSLNISNVLSDLYFEEGANRVLRYISQTKFVPLYFYQFSYKSKDSSVPDVPGVPHLGDLHYLFHIKNIYQEIYEGTEENLIRQQITELWTNFAKYGDPTPFSRDEVKVTWPQFRREHPSYLEIDSIMHPKTALHEDRMDFWNIILS